MKSRHYTLIHVLYAIACAIVCVTVWSCSSGISPTLDLPTGSKGYILYTFAKRTEVMIDFCKKDGISRGTKLDVYRMDVPDMEGPVKIGEISVEDVGRKMSKAKVTAITSSLRMESGDRLFPHPVIIVTDASWVASRMPVEGWKSDTASPDERSWEPCEVIPRERVGIEPEMRQLIADTDVMPVWHPSIKSHYGDVFFKKVFVLDAAPAAATLSVACGGRTNIYLNDRWVGEVKEWPAVDSFRVHFLLNEGRNVVAVHTIREPREKAPPVLFLALTVETKFQ